MYMYYKYMYVYTWIRAHWYGGCEQYVLTTVLQEFHNVDQNFIKLFKLSQLIIEYLLV